MKKLLIIGILFIGIHEITAQKFSRRDSLQGGMRFERACFDVLRYDLNITINTDERSIIGYNDISFKIIENTSKIQLDLFENMQVDPIVYNTKN